MRMETSSAQPEKSAVSPIRALLPQHPSRRSLAQAVQGCTNCDLYRDATQAVWGEGRAGAPLVLIGEQPGNEEDLRGHPFVGPAGRLLHELLAEAEIREEEVYLTNAVKHFKWEARGKRRIHVKPTNQEVVACRPWLDVELSLLRPRVVVCLGASAAQSFRGPGFRLTQHLGEVGQTAEGLYWMATLHPAAVLRMPTPEARGQARNTVLRDLRQARDLLALK